MVTRIAPLLFASLLLAACGGSAEFLKGDYVNGNESFDAGNFVSAIEAYDRSLIDDPTDVRSLYNRGLAAHELYLAEVRKDGAVDTTVAQRWLDLAATSYAQVLEFDSGNPRAISSRAMLYYDSGDTPAALAFLRENPAAGTEGETLPLWTHGAILEKQGEREAAVAMYREVLGIDETHLAAATACAALLVELGRLDEAETLIVGVLEEKKLDFTLRLQHAHITVLQARENGQNDAWLLAWRRLRAAQAIGGGRDWRLHVDFAEVAEALGDVGAAVHHLWVARESASDGQLRGDDGLRRAGVTPAKWRAMVSERLQKLYPRLTKWERAGGGATAERTPEP